MADVSDENVLTVAQVNEYIKNLLDGNTILSSVFVKGEISNFTNHYKTGHFYFTLKDSGGVIKSVMFKSFAAKLKFIPDNGMKIIAHGRISVFPRDGQYIFYTDGIEPDGIGALYIAYEQLKSKLQAEGLFDDSVKRHLPYIPLKIGIVTSPTGAAIRDMINILGRRFPFAEIKLFPALVQGEGASASLIEGLNYFNSCMGADVIIIGRGGGSIEDLWAFNDENLARTVRASSIPVISAVGHETDFTICDFAADKRAPTPSAAAEIAAPDTPELQRRIKNIIGRMELMIEQKIKNNHQKLKLASESRVLRSPANIIDDKRMSVLSDEQHLESSIKFILKDRRSHFERNAQQQLDNNIRYILQLKKGLFERETAKLNALNPLSIITRGYSAVFKSDGLLIKSIDQINIGEEFYFKTTDGDVTGEVKSKKGIDIDGKS